MTTNMEKFHFRLVLLGSNGTGKTSILNRFLFKKFETKYKPTVEDLFCKDFDLGNIEIKVDFLDTSGSMQFPAMRRLSITTGSAFLIVYAVNDKTSYDVLKMCIAEIQEIRPDFQEIPIVFAGNKCDVPRDERQVSKEVVSNYVYYELPRLRAKVIECSSKDNTNIDNIFKAYLSLARVTLSSAVSAGRKSPAQTNLRGSGSSKHKHSSIEEKSRASSVKIVLGVRKSCDAALSGGGGGGGTLAGSQAAKGQSSQKEANQAATIDTNSPNSKQATIRPTVNENYDSSTATVHPKRDNSTRSGQVNNQSNVESETEAERNSGDQVNLETAIQTKLKVNSDPKPRSRSLIWRPSRKSTKSTSDSSDCRIT